MKPRVYKCCCCTNSYNCRHNLNKHVRKFHANEIVECKYKKCPCLFKSTQDMEDHLAKSHENEENQFHCIYCDKILSMTNRVGHLNIYHKSQIMKCEYRGGCFTYFHNDEERKKHYVEVHEQDSAVTAKRIRCTICNSLVVSQYIYKHMRNRHKTEISMHRRATGAAPVYVLCPHCETLVKSTYIEKHISGIHNASPIKCNFKCGLFFLNHETRKEHIKEEHSSIRNQNYDNRARKCFYCGLKVQSVFRHIRFKHPDFIRCSLHQCATYFNTEEERKKHHEEKHSMAEQLKQLFCSKCDYRAFEHDALRKHMSVAHGVDKFVCSFCKKSFTFKPSLQRHILKCHLKSRQCAICKVYVSNLQKHALKGNCRARTT
jgi:hypothetical protein